MHFDQPFKKHSMLSVLITPGHLKEHFTQRAHVLQLHASNPSLHASNQNLLTFHASSSSDVNLSFRMGCTAQMNSAPTYWEIIGKCFSVQSVCMSPLCRCTKVGGWTQKNHVCSFLLGVIGVLRCNTWVERCSDNGFSPAPQPELPVCPAGPASPHFSQ